MYNTYTNTQWMDGCDEDEQFLSRRFWDIYDADAVDDDNNVDFVWQELVLST